MAAHLGDLAAARKCGFQTIYIDRPQEEGWDADKKEKAREEGWVDMWVGVAEGETFGSLKKDGGLVEVARRFGLEGDKSKI